MAMNKNRIIELCLVFLVSILSFSIGTFVGKKYSDNQHKLALLDPNYKHENISDENSARTTTETTPANQAKTTNAQVDPTITTDETASASSINDEHGNPIKIAITKSTPITDADVAKMAEEFSDDSTEDSSVVASKSNSENLVKTINEDGSVVDEAVAKKEKIAKVKTEKNTTKDVTREVANISEKAKSITAQDGKNQYTVQVGSFPSPAEAEKIATSLQARGYKASHSVANVNGKTWYRVQVGLFNSLQDAQTYKKDLVEQNHLSSAIIQRLTK